MAKNPRVPRRQNTQENFMAAALDKREFQMSVLSDISEAVLPILQQALREGWDRDKLLSHPKIELLMAARQASIAILEEDSSKALAAIKDATDRRHGKPTEKIETTHKLEKLPDHDLDAILLSKLKAADEAADEVH